MLEFEVANILCEFFEIAIHSILHSRNLYPESIFVRKKKYGVILYQSEHSLLNAYIKDVLKGIYFHTLQREIKRLFVCITSNGKLLERYVFDVLELHNNLKKDPLLVTFEQAVHSFYVKLHACNAYLSDLPSNAEFKIIIHTTVHSALSYNESPNALQFQWVQTNAKQNNESGQIIPIHTIEADYLTLQSYIEKFDLKS